MDRVAPASGFIDKSRGHGGRGRGQLIRGMQGNKAAPARGQWTPVRGKPRGRALASGVGPIRRGMGRIRPYPDPRGRRGGRAGPPGLPPPPPPPPPPVRGMIRSAFPPPPRPGLPPPPGSIGFRGRPPPPRARGMPPGSRRPFPHSRGFPNGPGAPPPPPPPPGRGQRWPGLPGGRRF